MKVVFIGLSGYDHPYVRVRCHNFAKLLRERGVEAEVLSFKEAFSPSVADDGMLRLRDPQKLGQTLRALCRLAGKRRAILYVQKAHWHAAAPFILRRLRLNRFVLDYDDWDLDRSPFFDRKRMNRLLFGADGVEPITRRVAVAADAVVASSGPLLELMRRYNPAAFLVPTGVDEKRFRRTGPPPEGPVTAVWCGKVWGRVIYENLRFCVDCVLDARRVHPSLRFVVAGDGAWMGRIEEYVRERGAGGVEFAGWIHPDRMSDFLSRAHIGLLPLVPDAENSDWMRCKSPTKLFEYMAMEIPTVASRYGEAVSIVADGQEAFLASERGEFAAKLAALAGDAGLRRAMGSRARRRVEERYCHRVMGDALLEAVECAAGLRGRLGG